MHKQNPIIRTIYLYLFALVGLVLVVISGIRFIDIGLKAFLFKQAEQEERLWSRGSGPYPPIGAEKLVEETDRKVEPREVIELGAEERQALARWAADYNDWVERSSQIDPIVARRQREASNSLAMALVGLPLYLYHWRVIQKQRKEEV